MSQGNLYIVAAPSGAGKTSLVQGVIDSLDDVMVSISYTTRPKRPGEHEDVNYHYVKDDEFERLIQQEVFLEYANVFGHYYGTPKAWVEARLAQHQDVILEIDWQGAEQVRKKMPQAISIFILPPSYDVLRERLEKRQQDTMEVIERRLGHAHDEVAHFQEFDYVIINQEFARALADLQAIIRAQRLLFARQQQTHPELLKKLMQ
jgi:guanylate kinase